MKRIEPTLTERAGRMYRRLLLLQRLFPPPGGNDLEAVGIDDRARETAFTAAVREVLDELTEHARLLTSVPFPIGEWRPGDCPDDERWRALTEVERRELRSLVSSYDCLIGWAEAMTASSELAALVGVAAGAPIARQSAPALQTASDIVSYLEAERSRVARFRQDMGSLTRQSPSE